MDKYINLLLPIGVSFISAFITGVYVAGRNIERVKVAEDAQEQMQAKLLELTERVAKLEGRNENQ